MNEGFDVIALERVLLELNTSLHGGAPLKIVEATAAFSHEWKGAQVLMVMWRYLLFPWKMNVGGVICSEAGNGIL